MIHAVVGDLSDTFVRRTEYSVPGPAMEAARTIKGAWDRVLRRLRPHRGRDTRKVLDDLERPTPEVLGRLVPELDLETPAAALAELLEGDRHRQPEESHRRVVVGTPGSRVPEILATVARRRNWRLLEPPTGEDLVSRHDRIGERLRCVEEGPTVVCRLERWFLRSESALPAIAAAVDVLRGARRPLLVGCDSWTWAFLDRAIGVEALLGEPLVPVPFDGARLAHWLGGPFRSGNLVCRQSKGSEELFPQPPAASSDEAAPAPARLFDELASLARGNPGVARALWSRSLHSGEADGDAAPPPADRERTWWALAPDETELRVPGDLDGLHRFVLHASLLHGGLPAELLSEALPHPRHDLLRRISDLQRAELLQDRGGELAVTLAAYPSVRNHLASNGLLVDGC